MPLKRASSTSSSTRTRMQHLADPLNALHEDAAWFARARDLRMLVVRTSGDVRKPVLTLLPGQEYHADNRSPWVVMQDPWEPRAPYWESRAARLLKDWEARREAFAAEGIEMPAVAEPLRRLTSPPTPERPGTDLFARACLAVLGALRSPLDGLVLVLAPSVVHNMVEVDADLTALLGRPELAGCRIVLVLDVDAGLPVRTLGWLAEAAAVCRCATDPVQKRSDLQALVGGGETASAGGGAGPAGVVPPRRVNAPPELDPADRDAALREAGIEPAYLEHAPALQRLIMGGALAMGDGLHEKGIALQAQAIALSAGLGMTAMAAICRITLASYFSAAGDRPRALKELATAREDAAAHGLSEQESQASLAEGMLHMLDGRALEAASAYYRCAQAAEKGGSGVLAVEAWRLAGQTSLQGGATEHGTQYLLRAVAVAGGLEPAVRRITSAPEAARGLAKVYERWGYAAHAGSLYAQADAFEAGAAPVPEEGGSASIEAAPAPPGGG